MRVSDYKVSRSPLPSLSSLVSPGVERKGCRFLCEKEERPVNKPRSVRPLKNRRRRRGLVDRTRAARGRESKDYGVLFSFSLFWTHCQTRSSVGFDKFYPKNRKTFSLWHCVSIRHIFGTFILSVKCLHSVSDALVGLPPPPLTKQALCFFFAAMNAIGICGVGK